MPNLREMQDAVEELFDRRDVSRVLKCSERTVINYEQRGLLNPIRIGGLVRFTPESVRQFIERQSAPTE